jgi:xanthine dehydrogenase large subunit
VNDRAIFHADNAYYLDAVDILSLRGLTHTVSNTAFRGFGGPQGMFAIESVIDDIARHLGLDPLAVRRPTSTAGRGNRNHPLRHEGGGQRDRSAGGPAGRQRRLRRPPRRHRRLQRHQPGHQEGAGPDPGEVRHLLHRHLLNQAGALVHVYNDGTVLVSHGGTEMGQGLYTKIRQIVAQEFGLPVEDVRLSSTDTSRVPNTSATAASSGTDLNGKAAQAACQAIRGRIAGFVAERLGVSQDAVRLPPARSAHRASTPLRRGGGRRLPGPRAAVGRRLLQDPKIHYDPVTMQGRPFYYFAYGASVSEVAIDTLTGESKVLRVDILHDVGRSINPAIDIGQIEGGFIQGMGWLTTEELVYASDGRLATHAPSTYKIPASPTCRRIFNVRLFDNANAEDSIHRSKAVGEPPLMLAFSVFFALRDAVAAALGPGARPARRTGHAGGHPQGPERRRAVIAPPRLRAQTAHLEVSP